MQDNPEQRVYKLETILSFAERLFTLHGIDENAPLSSSDSETGVLEEIRVIRQDLADLELREADVQSHDLLSDLLAQMQFSDKSTVNGFLDELRARLGELRSTVEQEAEQRSLYFVIPGYHFLRFQAPELMDPPIPLRVERFLDEAERCWDVGFELATVMLTLVATEVLNRHHYRTVVNPQEEKVQQTWGNLIKLYPESELRDHLDTVVEHRNQAMHGRLEVDERDAIEIIEQCAHVSNQLVDSLRASDEVRCPPNTEEFDVILGAASCVIGKASPETLVRILKGEEDQTIVDHGWVALQDFGALKDYSFPWIDDKVRWFFNHRYLKKDYDHGLKIHYDKGETKKRAMSLWVERLFSEFEECIGDESPQQAWTSLSALPRYIKRMLLKTVSSEIRHDFAPILYAWFEQEGDKCVRRAINSTLQGLDLQPLRHPLS
jgi:hypothetical protein